MRKYFLVCILSGILFSCSTEDKPDPSPKPAQNTLTGIFIDSPVMGLRYETETHSGFTDENGKYNYEEGETVTFYIGDIKLGSAKASEELSPLSISSTSNASLETLEVQNIAALLQTLDLDGDATNGITIDEEVVDVLSISEIDFSENIISILGKIALEVFEKTGIELQVVYPPKATIHLAESLNLEFEPSPSMALNFLPTFTNYYSPHNKAVNWVHEFDTEDRLVKSVKYEKFPNRILEEFIFKYNTGSASTIIVDHLTIDYSRYGKEFSFPFRVVLDDDFNLEKVITGSIAEYGAEDHWNFEELNDKKWVTTILSEFVMESGYKSNKKIELDYNEIGFITEKRIFDNSGSLEDVYIWTSTEFGEMKTEGNEEDSDITKYFYRSDNTLEKMIVEYEDPTLKFEHISVFDENEAIISYTRKDLIENRTTVRYYDARGTLSFEVYKFEVLREKTYYNLDHQNNYKLKTEYYDDNGELEYTVYFDQSGNVTDTIYE